MSLRAWACSFVLLLGSVFGGHAQNKHTISGIISDAASNETLIGVNVYFPNLQKGTITNAYGFYSIT